MWRSRAEWEALREAKNLAARKACISSAMARDEALAMSEPWGGVPLKEPPTPIGVAGEAWPTWFGQSNPRMGR